MPTPYGLAIGALVGIPIGAALALGLHQAWAFHLNREIDAVAIAELAVTIAIAVFLQRYFAQQASVEAAERDLIREQLKAVHIALSKARSRFLSLISAHAISRAGNQALLRDLRDLGNTIYLLEIAVDLCHPGNGWMAPVKQSHMAYRRALTESAVAGRPYPQGTLATAERQYRELAKTLILVARHVGRTRR